MKIDIGNCQEKLKSLLCSKDDPNYGKPDKNSASAMRAAAGEAKMRGEICDVCEIIFQNGQKTQDGFGAMQFGELLEVWCNINVLCFLLANLDLQQNQ